MLVISTFASMGGVSGAFLLLPFQMSVLGFDSPAVSPTNMLYNVVAIPTGVYRYIREGRMNWPLAWILVGATLPGLIIGVVVRVRLLPDPRGFKLFVGCVLLYLAARLVLDLTRRTAKVPTNPQGQSEGSSVVRTVHVSWRRVTFSFAGESYSFGVPLTVLIVLVVGVIGGVYGIGGGAIMAPFLVAVYRLPVYTIAGATLLSTFVSSVFGVAFYTVIAPLCAPAGMAVSPDWLLGLLFGLGGMIGIYLGARCQRFVPAKYIKMGLTAVLLFVSLRYILGYYL
jgi:uncharacterized membrane protein YfcA